MCLRLFVAWHVNPLHCWYTLIANFHPVLPLELSAPAKAIVVNRIELTIWVETKVV
jgi:hypothetical protein